MRIRAFVYALVALGAVLPVAAAAAVTYSTTLTVPAGDVPAGSVVPVTCKAEGHPDPGAMGLGDINYRIDRIDLVVGAGSATPLQWGPGVNQPCSIGDGKTCNFLQGVANWTTPATPGTLTATCTVSYSWDRGGVWQTQTPVSSSATVTTVTPPPILPPVVTGIDGPLEVAAGATGMYVATATDPQNLPLTYTWSATGGGTITPDPANPAVATWQPPATLGQYQVKVAVANALYTVEAQKSVNAVLATYQSNLPLPLSAPRKLASAGGTGVFVVDAEQTAGGQILLATARGDARGFAQLPEPALAVASGAGVLWVTTIKTLPDFSTVGHLYKVDPVTGKNLGEVPLAGGPFMNPYGIAYNPATMTLWIADKDTNRVRVITPDGATVAIIGQVNGARITAPVDVAVDEGANRVYVVVLEAKSEGALLPGEPIQAARFVHAFDLAGQYVASYVPYGGALGQMSRAGGIGAAGGRIYVSDIFQGTVQVLTSGGTPISTVGTWGQGVGQLENPTGLALLGNGDVAVANTTRSRIERFGNGAALPTCAGDADCDLLSDAWEIANGYDPNWAGNALLDLDGDGLNNAQELAAGTNPNNRDTDGDGYSDGDELATGFDPLNPNDHKALCQAGGPAETGPGLVKLSATAQGPAGSTCSVAWTQPLGGGPSVPLQGADTANPTFIARAAGTYLFDAVATCGTLQSVPSRASVVVNNVAPLVEAGGVLVAAPGMPVRLDALGSSDANADPLAFTWDQHLGVPLIGTATTGAVTLRPRGAGYYLFEVTTSDGATGTATAQVPVVVTEGQAPTAVAAAIPSEAPLYSLVSLDARTSIVGAGATYAWQQVSGPAATLSGANQANAMFVPQAPGRYVFEVAVASGGFRAPPARVEVFVAAQGGVLPTVTASAPSVVAVSTPVTLDATPTPSGAQVKWRQVSGPAAGLTDATSASATVVPFAAGFHVFEASVQDGAVAGRPARVAFEARVGGQAIPQARVTTAPGDAWVGQLVFLDGRSSTGAARFRWSQVSGPWVALGLQSGVASFRPLVPGLYAFELVVDDNTTRSAPTRIEINVVAPPEGVR